MNSNSSPKKKKTKFIIFATLPFITVLIIFWLALLHSSPDDNLYNAKKIPRTHFKIYQNKVYVTIPSNGDYLVLDADPNSITRLESKGYTPQLAKDNNHVFCGNKIIPQLHPNNIKVSFYGYIADDHNAYYCDYAKRNPNLSIFEEIIGAYKTAFDSDKPLTYYNEIVTLNSDSPTKLVSIASSYAKDDNAVYYKGKKIENADANTISEMFEAPSVSGQNRTSAHYVQDKNHVYYRGEALPDATPEKVKLYLFQENKFDYAYDPKIDQFYIGAVPFPRFIEIKTSINADIKAKLENKDPQKTKKTRYSTEHLQFLNVTNDHTNHDLFFNDEGIFYWEYRKKELILACPTPFNVNEIKIFKDGFFADDKNSYFLLADEVWRQGRTNKSLANRQTQIIRINNIAAKNWKKLADVNDQYSSQQGIIWEANNEFYFETSIGQSNGFKSTLYKIKNIDNLISEKLESSKNEDLYVLKIDRKKLSNYIIPIDGDLVCVAKTDY